MSGSQNGVRKRDNLVRARTLAVSGPRQQKRISPRLASPPLRAPFEEIQTTPQRRRDGQNPKTYLRRCATREEPSGRQQPRRARRSSPPTPPLADGYRRQHFSRSITS